ncbi:MAG: 16S rRNA (cytosine(967)-C(5))-methyltransferase RsmB [Terriglobia bacterium]
MPISPAREAALYILERVEAGQSFAVDLLQSPRVSRLKDADRRLTTELVMGVLRWRGDLDLEIEKLSAKPLSYFDPEVVEVLRLGIYQIRHLENIPAHAAVYESVEMVKAARKRSAAGLVNAILRKCKRSPFEPGTAGAAAEYLERARLSIPSWIHERWQQNFGDAEADSVTLASQSVPQTCLRASGSHFSREALRQELEEAGVQTELGAFGERALRVKSGNVLSTAAWREGRVAIQDEASQLVAALIRPEPGQRALDLCAAPGIKAGQIADDMREGTHVACDRSLRRLRTMEKITRDPWPKAVARHVVLLDATHPLPFATLFDRVLVDAPCSGTGTLARNPEIKWRLRREDILRLAGEQLRILQNGLDALAPGGRLVYSTCSLEPEENEQVVAKALAGRHGHNQVRGDELQREFPELAGLFDGGGAFHTRPGEQPLDGFFAVVIERV